MTEKEPAGSPSEQELDRYILKRLTGMQSRNNLIYEICERSELDWKKAKQRVAQVERTHWARIHWVQLAFMLLICLAAIVVGIFQAATSISVLLTSLQYIPVVHDLFNTAAFQSADQGVSTYVASATLPGLVIGIALVVGAILALVRIILNLRGHPSP